jgi:adenylylsulfate reductase subunit A
MADVIEHSCDLLILGGGAAGCMAAIEAKQRSPHLEVLVMEKAHVDRSGCLAAGIGTINAYLHEGETAESYLRYVLRETAGVARDDLTLSMAAELNAQVRRVEQWGLAIPRDERGAPLQRGRRSIKVFGERIKPILGKRAEASGAKILNRVNATGLALHEGRVVGAFGFGTRDRRFHALHARAVLVCTGGAAGLYRPNNPGLTGHRIWYSPFNTGAGLAMGIRAGAELTSLEFRFIPLRLKDAAAATGEIGHGLCAQQTNAAGEAYLEKYYGHLGGRSMSCQDRLYATLQESRAGRGPCYLSFNGVDEKHFEQTIRSCLSMTPAGAILMSEAAARARAASGDARIEIAAGEPNVIGGHGLCGYWVDAARRTTLPGLWAAGDVAGGTAKKYASGAWAEAVIAVRDIVGSLRDTPRLPFPQASLQRECARVLAPCQRPDGRAPLALEERLQQLMDAYAGGSATHYGYSEGGLQIARLHLQRLEAELCSLHADTPFALLQCHDVIDRVLVARALVEHMSHRRETRWHCFQERLDYPDRDDARWQVFVNSVQRGDGSFRLIERPVAHARVPATLPPLADGAIVRHQARM